MARETRKNTRFEILEVAVNLFLNEGYSNSYVTTIAKKLDISLGNLTFHYPTKEHLLEELIKYLCDYQLMVMEHEVEEGKTSLLAYLLELTAIAAICDENEIAKDLYVSAYTHVHSLKLIRGTDAQKTKLIFKEFCPNWTDEDFIAAENIVSGIEYSLIYKDGTEEILLDKRITSSLDAIMKLYNVPQELRRAKIEKIHKTDYQRIGRRFIEGFSKYVEERNKKARDELLEIDKEKS